MVPADFLDVVRLYCARFAASVTSYGRTGLHNESVGGVPGSSHQFWLGVDVVYDVFVPEPARRLVATRLGLRLIVEGDHDHLQPLDWPAG